MLHFLRLVAPYVMEQVSSEEAGWRLWLALDRKEGNVVIGLIVMLHPERLLLL